MRIHRECPVVNQQRSHGWALVMGTSPNLDHGGSWDLQIRSFGGGVGWGLADSATNLLSSVLFNQCSV